MENPLIRVRKDSNLAVTDFAILADTSSVTINRIENGLSKKICVEILQAVEYCGHDPIQFEKDYHEWRSLKLDSIKDKVKK